MNDIEIKLLNAKLYLNYYKNNNILDRYATIIERLVIDNDCLSVLKNPNEKLYITPLSKNVNKEEKYKDLEQIEKEHKEENGRLREENKNLEKELEEKDIQHELELIGKEEFTKANMAEIIEHYYTANEDCIPISKLKEIVDECIPKKREYNN